MKRVFVRKNNPVNAQEIMSQFKSMAYSKKTSSGTSS
ncbi:uncharacterized protein METZ01_LOCUS73534, partial [marine metagenome]